MATTEERLERLEEVVGILEDLFKREIDRWRVRQGTSPTPTTKEHAAAIQKARRR